MNKMDEIIEYLEKNKIKEKDYFDEYFTLGNYIHQDQSQEKFIELTDCLIATLALDTHDYASISVFDKEGYQIDNFYVTYETLQKLLDKLEV